MSTKAVIYHDTFNIVSILALNILNLLNWSYEPAVWTANVINNGPEEWGARWAGTYQELFLWATVGYVTLDTLIIMLFPKCVPGPMALVVHHVFMLVSLLIPILYGTTHGYTLGLFMAADFNTIFLIIRKKMIGLKKNGADSRLFQLAFFVNDLCFYGTWVIIRLVLFPAWLLYVSVPEWASATASSGSHLNWFLIMPSTNSAVCVMNFVWTASLVQSTLKQMQRKPAKQS